MTFYEDLVKALENRQRANREFQSIYISYLNGVLIQLGFKDQVVREICSGSLGVLKIEASYSPLHPYEIKFFPLRRDGEISARNIHISNYYPWDEKRLLEQLKTLFIKEYPYENAKKKVDNSGKKSSS